MAENSKLQKLAQHSKALFFVFYFFYAVALARTNWPLVAFVSLLLAYAIYCKLVS